MKSSILISLITLGLSSAFANDITKKAEVTKRLFKTSQMLFEAKKYDLAFSCCDQILEIDPYNIPARKRQEQINRAKIISIKAKSSRDEELIYPTLPPQYLGKTSSPKTSK